MVNFPYMAIKTGRFSRLQALGGLGATIASNAVSSLGDRLLSGRDAALSKLHEKMAIKMLETFSGMKGLPMKVGQVLSFMDGVIPAEFQEIYRKTLTKLQVQANPHTWAQIQTTFEREFGKPPEAVFASFDRTPIAAASIGQVYRGRLHDGREVAIKIQYPEISEALASDLKNMDGLIRMFRTVLPSFDTTQLSGDLISRFAEELDYVLEAENQLKFCQCWKDDPKVVIPAPIMELSRRRVLVTELHKGMSFSEVLSSSSHEMKSAYGEVLYWFTFHSILTHGLFNADPHPGNYLFHPDGRMVFLDFGSVQKYTETSRAAFRKLLHAITSGTQGEALWSVIEETLLVPPGTSPELRNMLLEHFLFVMEPIRAPQPFGYTSKYAAEVSELGLRAKLELGKQIFKVQWREPKREGLAPLMRINFGLNSILAALEARQDWRALLLRA